MRACAFKTILPASPITELPTALVQTPSRTSPFLFAALALPAAAAVLAPFGWIAAHAASHPSMLLNRPDSAALAGLALFAFAAVFLLPIVRRARNSLRRRHILLSPDQVQVSDRGLAGTSTWTQPLKSYRGIAHHVRTSLSGVRHEVLLIHPNPAYSLLLRAADRINQSEVDSLARLLGCREIAPQVFYRNTSAVGRDGLAAATV